MPFSVLFLSLGILGALLLGPPKAVDQFADRFSLIPLFMIFLYWAGSVLAWGSLIQTWIERGRRTKGQFPLTSSFTCTLACIWGVLSNALFIEICGLLGFIGQKWSPLYWGWSALGLILFGLFKSSSDKSVNFSGPPFKSTQFRFASVLQTLRSLGSTLRCKKKSLDSLVIVLVLFAVFLRILLGFKLHSHGDPLYYNLLGPRLWFNQGRISLIPEHLILFQCGLWDALYLWPHQLLASQGAGGAAEVQYFSQWIHSLFGLGGTLLVLWTWMRRYGISQTWTGLTLLAISGLPSLFGTASIAKNDWGAVFFTLSGALFLFPGTEDSTHSSNNSSRNFQKSTPLMGGLLLGAAFAIKYTTAITSLALVLTWIVAEYAQASSPSLGHPSRDRLKKLIKDLAWLIVGAVSVAGVYCGRNTFFTGNPLFPTYADLFSTNYLGPSLLDYFKHHERKPLLEQAPLILMRLKDTFFQSVLHFSWLLLPVLVFLKKKRDFSFWPLWMASSLAFFLYCVVCPPVVLPRLFGPGLVLITCVSGMIAARVFQKVRGAGWIALGVLLVSIEYPLYAPFQLLPSRLPPTQTAILGHTAGQAKAWLRAHVNPQDRILSLADNEIYYLVPLTIIVSDYHPEFDREAYSIRDSKRFLAILRKFQIQWILDENRGPHNAMIRDLVAKNPDAVVFQEEAAKILSVDKLMRGLQDGGPL